jgi:hypothetical protein
LHQRWGQDVEFVTIVIRQGHPGPAVPPYRSYEDKERDARAHQREDRIPWTVLVDTLDGSAHRAYGMLADPTFLLDRDGRVAFYNTITHAPTLHTAITELMDLGGLGVTDRGFDRRVHALPIIAAGWPAIRRGLPQSAVDLELAMPGSAAAPLIGYQLRGALAPIALRAEPLPPSARWLALAAVAALTAGAIYARRSRHRDVLSQRT